LEIEIRKLGFGTKDGLGVMVMMMVVGVVMVGVSHRGDKGGKNRV
jgi:hypothetical protein